MPEFATVHSCFRSGDRKPLKPYYRVMVRRGDTQKWECLGFAFTLPEAHVLRKGLMQGGRYDAADVRIL